MKNSTQRTKAIKCLVHPQLQLNETVMYIPIKDASLEYRRYEENVGFLRNIKMPDKEKVQGIAIKTCMAFSILGASVFTISALKHIDANNMAVSQNSEGEPINHPGRYAEGLVGNAPINIKIAEAPKNTEAPKPHTLKERFQETQEKISLSLGKIGKVHEKLSFVGNFKLPETLKQNNYPKAIAEHQLNKGEYYLALVSYAEGFSPTIKPDNKGYFIGFGWNLTLNSSEDNEHIAKMIGMSKKHTETVKNLSHQSKENVSLEDMRSVKITPQQGMQAAYLIGEKIRKEKVIPGIQRVLIKHRNQEQDESLSNAINVFNSLGRHQQDMMVYHGYKAGNQFLTFKNLVLNVVDYAEKSPETSQKDKLQMKEEVIKELDYSFTRNGKKYFDKRAQDIIGTMFLGPEKFAEKFDLSFNPDVKAKAKPILIKL